ncbi:cytochrome c551 [Lentibacillus cibarius]|uniref:Cytochrome c n=1 Tax=Lentibacillus cibarius TaxID=2583219 RepID=A0A5S3QLJ0_9BACI|nr:cytochrome c [Lentibacillus cibarius]TMN21346.1 cytochrome c [Lentibacillus cibarius]
MKKGLLSILFGTALVLGACGGGDDGGTDNGDNGDTGTEEPAGENGESTAAAEEIFQNNCASCHGGDLSGGAGPDLREVGSDYSSDEIVDIIQNGKDGMPPQDVSDEDAQALASWLAEKK